MKIKFVVICFQVFSSLEDVVRSSYRRSLCYPLYRHWKLNQSVKQDVVHILQLGKQFCIICSLYLLHTRREKSGECSKCVLLLYSNMMYYNHCYTLATEGLWWGSYSGFTLSCRLVCPSISIMAAV